MLMHRLDPSPSTEVYYKIKAHKYGSQKESTAELSNRHVFVIHTKEAGMHGSSKGKRHLRGRLSDTTECLLRKEDAVHAMQKPCEIIPGPSLKTSSTNKDVKIGQTG